MYDLVAATPSGHPGIDRWDSVFNGVCAWAKTTHGLLVPPNLVKAHCLYESGGDPEVFGPPNGAGLMQIDYGTTWSGGAGGQGTPTYDFEGAPRDMYDPWWNVKVAVVAFIGPNVSAFPANLGATIAAFNAGVAPVQAALDAGRDPSTTTTDPLYVPHVREAFDWLVGVAHRALEATA
jgi:hypothetical protein